MTTLPLGGVRDSDEIHMLNGIGLTPVETIRVHVRSQLPPVALPSVG